MPKKKIKSTKKVAPKKRGSTKKAPAKKVAAKRAPTKRVAAKKSSVRKTNVKKISRKRKQRNNGPETHLKLGNLSLDFNYKDFITETQEVLVSPKKYFLKMRKNGGFVYPVIKAAIYGLVAGILSAILSKTFLGVFNVTALINSTILAVFIMAVGTIILHLIAKLCKGDSKFEDTAQAAASIMVIHPIYSVLTFFMLVDLSLMIVLMALASLFFLYLLFHAVVHGLGGNRMGARTITSIFAILALLYWGHVLYIIHNPLYTLGNIMQNQPKSFNQVMKNPGVKESMQDIEGMLQDMQID